MKPKTSLPIDTARSASANGVKRAHSPSRVNVTGMNGFGDTSGSQGQTNLEARLAALEAMLGDVPPKVHNAFLSSLDARLGSGTGVGIKEGKGEGVGVALEALAGSGDFNSFDNLGSGSGQTWTQPSVRLDNLSARMGQTLSPDWGMGASGSNGLDWLGGMNMGRMREDEGVDQMAKRMEGMSFFYKDEIGQAKWQGASVPYEVEVI